jgi:hypothetical protein
MADKKIQLKRNTDGTNIDNLFPVARITDILQSDGTTTFLDGNSKIRLNYLPNSVFDNLRFTATLLGSNTLRDLAFSAINTASGFNRSPIGIYWVAGTAGTTITNNFTAVSHTSSGITAWVKTFLTPADNGEVYSTSDITDTLEAGDWLVISRFEGVGTEADPYVFYFGVVENTYELATTAVDGIVRLSSSTSTATTGNAVITNGILNGLVGTTSTKLAAGNHLHTGVYEPANTALTNLGTTMASLSTGTLVKTGVDTFGLNSDTYLSDSTSSTQNGYFGNIHLRDDSTPSHYLAITASSNLTANRTLSLATGDAARTLTFGGDITTATGNLTINAQSGGSTLSLPSTLTIGSVTANGILFGSSADNVGMIASTTIGRNTLTIPDIAAISFARYNADETISMLDASTFRTAIGAGTSSTTGTVTSIATSGAITGGTITTTGTISHSTADGNLHVPATSTTNNRRFLVAGSTAGSFAWEAFPRTFYDTTAGTISGDIIFDEVA